MRKRISNKKIQTHKLKHNCGQRGVDGGSVSFERGSGFGAGWLSDWGCKKIQKANTKRSMPSTRRRDRAAERSHHVPFLSQHGGTRTIKKASQPLPHPNPHQVNYMRTKIFYPRKSLPDTTRAASTPPPPPRFLLVKHNCNGKQKKHPKAKKNNPPKRPSSPTPPALPNVPFSFPCRQGLGVGQLGLSACLPRSS